MSIEFRKTQDDEIVLLHDFYFASSEPDAPTSLFQNLNEAEKSKVIIQFPVESYFTFYKDKELIGFVGFFPDDNSNVNIFYVLSPEQRNKGYFKELLKIVIGHCQSEFAGFEFIRVLTRLQNTASIKGLQSGSFVYQGQIIEGVQPDVIYEEYIYPIKL